jgi:Zn-dependent peptidase ImmA (M78 family)
MSKKVKDSQLECILENGSMYLFSKIISVQKFKSNSRTDTAFGRSDDLMNVISINESIPLSNQEETLLHEVIHLIESNLGLELQEKQVQGLSVGLYDFLKSNGFLD